MIKRYKYAHGLSNWKLGKQLGVDEATVANWERNQRVPTKKRMKYVLSLITKHTS
ncbi:helix-turn-helix domain-containing protein [Sediminibacterium sp.]|uniref:helix-turn-helix domain-containing protein n=1 Tax=Sediminibacterium sp. TaxID=1917865 RepID=UPI003440CFAB